MLLKKCSLIVSAARHNHHFLFLFSARQISLLWYAYQYPIMKNKLRNFRQAEMITNAMMLQAIRSRNFTLFNKRRLNNAFSRRNENKIICENQKYKISSAIREERLHARDIWCCNHSLIYFKPVEGSIRPIARRMRTEEPGGPDILRIRVPALLVTDATAYIVRAGAAHGARRGRGRARGSSHGLSLRKAPIVSMRELLGDNARWQSLHLSNM